MIPTVKNKIPSRASRVNYGIETLQFNPSIFGSKLPIALTRESISTVFPSHNFRVQRFFVRDTAIKTLTGQNTQFNLGNIQPTAMRMSVMELKLVENAPCLSRGEGLSSDNGIGESSDTFVGFP